MDTADLSAIDHLLLGRAGLVRERDRLNAAIAAIDAVVTDVKTPLATTAAPQPPAQPTDTADLPLPPPTGKVPSVREGILIVLGSEDREFSLREVIDKVALLGVQAQDDTVRSIVIKLLGRAKIIRPRRGMYRLPPRLDAETPGDTGVSGGDRPDTEGRSLEERSRANGAVSSGDHAEGSSLQALHRDHPDGAPVSRGT
jgi:hypothetical protein